MSENAAKQQKRRKRKMRFKTVRKIVKWLIILCLLLAAGLFGLKAYIQNQAVNSDQEETYSRAAATRGALADTVYGTGTTSAVNQPNILAQADGTLTDLRVSIGDEVKAGDVLAVITNDTIDDTITDLEFALWDLDDEIAGTGAGSKVYTIEAPVAGRVMALYAQKGDDALAVFRREGAVAVISTDGRMKVTLESNARLTTALNDRVTVVSEEAGVNVEGTVTNLTHQSTHATITILSDELPWGAPVKVYAQDGALLGEGTLEINKPMAVSSYGGTINTVSVKVGDTVKRGHTIYKLEDSPLTLTIENLRLQREAAALELETAKEQRENLIVVAPCDGVIATVDVTEGTEITSGTLLMSILEGEEMSLTIAVDELDVVSVEQGQKVLITVDAFSDEEFSGEVLKIAPVGTNSGGVTTYDVQLAFEAEGTGVRSGMNATGEITIAEKSDALYVPVEALMTISNETYVMVADGGSQSLSSAAKSAGGSRQSRGQMPDMSGMPDFSGNMPDFGSMPGRSGETQETGDQSLIDRAKSLAMRAYAKLNAWLYEGVQQSAEQVTGSLVKVTTGLQNDEYVEILSGLSEGDVVLYTGGEEESSSRFGGFGGGSMGGFGGGGMNMGGMRMGF